MERWSNWTKFKSSESGLSLGAMWVSEVSSEEKRIISEAHRFLCVCASGWEKKLVFVQERPIYGGLAFWACCAADVVKFCLCCGEDFPITCGKIFGGESRKSDPVWKVRNQLCFWRWNFSKRVRRWNGREGSAGCSSVKIKQSSSKSGGAKKVKAEELFSRLAGGV